MSGIRCPRCSQVGAAGSRFCESCGAALPRACPSCGHLGSPKARFCGGCGRPIEAARVSNAPVSAPAPHAYTPRHLAERILTQRSALEGERKQVTVLFADLKGSMEIEIGVWAGIQLLNLGWRAGLTAEQARSLFEEGLELAKLAKDSSAASGFYVTYGAVKGMAGEPERALELVTEAARLAREAGDLGTEIATEAALVQSQIMTGRLRDALATIERALAASTARPGIGSQQTGFDPRTWLLMMRGGVRIEAGDLPGAERDLAQALEDARRLGEVEIVGWTHEMIGYLARWLGDADGSLAHARQAVEIAERMGSAFSQASAYGTLGLAHRFRGEWPDAAIALEHALEVIRKRRTFLHWEAASLSQLAEVDAALGRRELARARADEAVELARRRGTRFIELLARLSRARVVRETEGLSARAEVLRDLARVEALVAETGAASWLPLVHVERAELARLAEDEVARARELELARRGFVAIGASVLTRGLDESLTTMR